MLKIYRNLAAEMITAAGYQLSDFTTAGDDPAKPEMPWFSLTLTGTGMYFKFTLNEIRGVHSFYTKRTKLLRVIPQEGFSVHKNNSWVDKASLIQELREWLHEDLPEYFKAKADLELDASLPDLWSDSGGASKSLPTAKTDDNSTFTTVEIERIASSLNRLKDDVRAKPLLTPEQAALLDAKIDEMIASSSRLGRKDWINAVIGGFTGYVIQGALTPPVTRELFSMASQALHWISNVPPLLLP